MNFTAKKDATQRLGNLVQVLVEFTSIKTSLVVEDL